MSHDATACTGSVIVTWHDVNILQLRPEVVRFDALLAAEARVHAWRLCVVRCEHLTHEAVPSGVAAPERIAGAPQPHRQHGVAVAVVALHRRAVRHAARSPASPHQSASTSHQ